MQDQAAMESQNIIYILVLNTQVALDAVWDSVVNSLGGGWLVQPQSERSTACYEVIWEESCRHPSRQRMDSPAACATICAMLTAGESNPRYAKFSHRLA